MRRLVILSLATIMCLGAIGTGMMIGYLIGEGRLWEDFFLFVPGLLIIAASLILCEALNDKFGIFSEL